MSKKCEFPFYVKSQGKIIAGFSSFTFARSFARRYSEYSEFACSIHSLKNGYVCQFIYGEL